jgi:hypothetical protein
MRIGKAVENALGRGDVDRYRISIPTSREEAWRNI